MQCAACTCFRTMHKMLQQNCSSAERAHTSSRIRTNLNDVSVIHVTVSDDLFESMTLNSLSLSLSLTRTLSMTFIAYETTTLNFKSQRRCTHTHKPHHHQIDNDIFYIYIVRASVQSKSFERMPLALSK